MAIKNFADDITLDIYHGLNTKAARRVPRTVWPAAVRKMMLVSAADGDLAQSAERDHRREAWRDRGDRGAARSVDGHGSAGLVEPAGRLRSVARDAGDRRVEDRTDDSEEVGAVYGTTWIAVTGC